MGNEIKQIENLGPISNFNENIVIEEKNKALKEAKKYWIRNILLIDGFQLGEGNIKAVVS